MFVQIPNMKQINMTLPKPEQPDLSQILVESRKKRGDVLILRKACQEQAEGNKPQNRKLPSIGSNIRTSKKQQILYSLVLRKPDSG